MKFGIILFFVMLISGSQSYAEQLVLFPETAPVKTEIQIQSDLNKAGMSNCSALNQAREDLVNRANWVNRQSFSDDTKSIQIENLNFAIDAVDVQIMDSCV